MIATLKPGDIVILDNLGSHKAKDIRDAIRATGTRLWFLPKYSPNLNPIEQAAAKIKHVMRMALKRTIEDIGRQLGHLAETINQEECQTSSTNARKGSKRW